MVKRKPLAIVDGNRIVRRKKRSANATHHSSSTDASSLEDKEFDFLTAPKKLIIETQKNDVKQTTNVGPMNSATKTPKMSNCTNNNQNEIVGPPPRVYVEEVSKELATPAIKLSRQKPTVACPAKFIEKNPPKFSGERGSEVDPTRPENPNSSTSSSSFMKKGTPARKRAPVLETIVEEEGDVGYVEERHTTNGPLMPSHKASSVTTRKKTTREKPPISQKAAELQQPLSFKKPTHQTPLSQGKQSFDSMQSLATQPLMATVPTLSTSRGVLARAQESRNNSNEDDMDLAADDASLNSSSSSSGAKARVERNMEDKQPLCRAAAADLLLAIAMPMSNEAMHACRKSLPDNEAVVQAMLQSSPNHKSLPEPSPLLGLTVRLNSLEGGSLDDSELTLDQCMVPEKKHKFPQELVKSMKKKVLFKPSADEEKETADDVQGEITSPTVFPDNGCRRIEDLDTETNAKKKVVAVVQDPSPPLWTAEAAGHFYHGQIFQLPNGQRFRHPPLPPGWSLRISRTRNRPYYHHPDFGNTFYPPIALPSLHGDNAATQTVPVVQSTAAKPAASTHDDLITPPSGAIASAPPNVAALPPVNAAPKDDDVDKKVGEVDTQNGDAIIEAGTNAVLGDTDRLAVRVYETPFATSAPENHCVTAATPALALPTDSGDVPLSSRHEDTTFATPFVRAQSQKPSTRGHASTACVGPASVGGVLPFQGPFDAKSAVEPPVDTPFADAQERQTPSTGVKTQAITLPQHLGTRAEVRAVLPCQGPPDGASAAMSPVETPFVDTQGRQPPSTCMKTLTATFPPDSGSEAVKWQGHSDGADVDEQATETPLVSTNAQTARISLKTTAGSEQSKRQSEGKSIAEPFDMCESEIVLTVSHKSKRHSETFATPPVSAANAAYTAANAHSHSGKSRKSSAQSAASPDRASHNHGKSGRNTEPESSSSNTTPELRPEPLGRGTSHSNSKSASAENEQSWSHDTIELGRSDERDEHKHEKSAEYIALTNHHGTPAELHQTPFSNTIPNGQSVVHTKSRRHEVPSTAEHLHAAYTDSRFSRNEYDTPAIDQIQSHDASRFGSNASARQSSCSSDKSGSLHGKHDEPFVQQDTVDTLHNSRRPRRATGDGVFSNLKKSNVTGDLHQQSLFGATRGEVEAIGKSPDSNRGSDIQDSESTPGLAGVEKHRGAAGQQVQPSVLSGQLDANEDSFLPPAEESEYEDSVPPADESECHGVGFASSGNESLQSEMVDSHSTPLSGYDHALKAICGTATSTETRSENSGSSAAERFDSPQQTLRSHARSSQAGGSRTETSRTHSHAHSSRTGGSRTETSHTWVSLRERGSLAESSISRGTRRWSHRITDELLPRCSLQNLEALPISIRGKKLPKKRMKKVTVTKKRATATKKRAKRTTPMMSSRAHKRTPNRRI